MNENIEKVLAILDGFRMSDEITYSAYSALYDEISLLDDLLKEQEPHLLTLDEIQNAKDIPAYWFEDNEGYMTSSLSTIYDWYGHNISFVTEDKEGYLEGYTYPDTQYGKTWRCWSSKPTDEQRKKVQWDENKAGPVQD